MKRTPLKGKKHKRTQATDIPPEVKRTVYERDKHCCVYCGSPNGLPEAHYIARSHGGLGIEQNLLTLCRVCHDTYDHTYRREEMRAFFRNYLMVYYADWEWSEDKLIYKRG